MNQQTSTSISLSVSVIATTTTQQQRASTNVKIAAGRRSSSSKKVGGANRRNVTLPIRTILVRACLTSCDRIKKRAVFLTFKRARRHVDRNSAYYDELCRRRLLGITCGVLSVCVLDCVAPPRAPRKPDNNSSVTLHAKQCENEQKRSVVTRKKKVRARARSIVNFSAVSSFRFAVYFFFVCSRQCV